jgi:monothiol glutaredoxin
MARHILSEQQIHPTIRDTVSRHERAIVEAVQAAVAANDVVVVGMRFNPFPKKSRALLDAAGIAYRYLEYGSYTGQWRRRNALKLWSGWPTFPMVFVKGVLIGGYAELKALHEQGELRRMLAGG